jgi:hypothetical protein
LSGKRVLFQHFLDSAGALLPFRAKPSVHLIRSKSVRAARSVNTKNASSEVPGTADLHNSTLVAGSHRTVECRRSGMPHGQRLELNGTQPRQEEETHQWRDISHTAKGMRTLAVSNRNDTCSSTWPDMKQPCWKGPPDSHVDPFGFGINDCKVPRRSRLEDVSVGT